MVAVICKTILGVIALLCVTAVILEVINKR